MTSCYRFYQKEGNELFRHQNCWLKQDGGNSHTDQKVEQWCRKNFKLFISKDRWPSNSPELNFLRLFNLGQYFKAREIWKCEQNLMIYVEKLKKR